MRHSLFLLLPVVLAGATRSLALGIQLPGKWGVHPTIPTEAEYEALIIAIFCLTGLLLYLGLMIRFPDLGAVIAEYNQF
jgi:hypothetical protein